MNENAYSHEELIKAGLNSVGENVIISKKTSLYKLSGKIGSNVRIDDFCTIIGKIEIGDFVHIGPGCRFNAGQAVILVRDYASISSNVSIFGSSDNFTGDSLLNPCVPEKFRGSAISIDVFVGTCSCIGANSVLLPGSTIPDYSSIGALSVTNQSTKLEIGVSYSSRAVNLIPIATRDIDKIKLAINNLEKQSTSD